MAFTITVELVSAGKAQVFKSGFRKREFKGETLDAQYPQVLKFVLTKDRVDLLDQYHSGDIVDVDFVINGREVERKDGNGTFHVMELQVLRIAARGQNGAQGAAPAPAKGGSPRPAQERAQAALNSPYNPPLAHPVQAAPAPAEQDEELPF
ncbi:MAG: DUF3127 domain-containing protein [Candidatus Spyradenecus sp.]